MIPVQVSLSRDSDVLDAFSGHSRFQCPGCPHRLQVELAMRSARDLRYTPFPKLFLPFPEFLFLVLPLPELNGQNPLPLARSLSRFRAST